jgi:Ser/Thr protein kinase RdoA (MazF antagonist)
MKGLTTLTVRLGPSPDPADLGFLLRHLHRLEPPPVPLPAYQPLVSVRRAIEASLAIDEEERGWLRTRCEQLQAAYCKLSFPLPAGMIHGDAWRGNLLRDGQRVVLADWDTVSTGHREVDLIPTLQAPRFGLREEERDAFVAAYGRDIRSWDGYPVLRDMRELSTLSAILRDGHTDAVAKRELVIRLKSLRSGDDQRWTSF